MRYCISFIAAAFFQETCQSGVAEEVCRVSVARTEQTWGTCTPERHCAAECTAEECTARKLLRQVAKIIHSEIYFKKLIFFVGMSFIFCQKF